MPKMRNLALLASAGALLGMPALAQAPEGLPDYYPGDYQQIVEGSRSEDGLVIYSNMAEYNWAPVIEGFNELYPWIQVQTLDLNSGEVFERYYAESASGTDTGDMLVSGAPDKWLEFNERGAALEYDSPEVGELPEFAQPLPNIYTVSTDPLVLAYNKKTISEDLWPTSFEDLVAKATDNPDTFQGTITTYNVPQSSFGFAAAWALAEAHGEQAWDWWEAIGPMTRSERSSGPMVEKITSGEYNVGYFISGIVLFPKMEGAMGEIVGWHFFEDGTPLFLRGMAIPKESGSPNSAKLMLDYVLSSAGQLGFGVGGLTPYREDVPEEEVLGYTYQSVVEAIGGEDKTILIDYDEEMLTQGEEFRKRWAATLQQ
jgi:iron(III) transport system substrate-binding protein